MIFYSELLDNYFCNSFRLSLTSVEVFVLQVLATCIVGYMYSPLMEKSEPDGSAL